MSRMRNIECGRVKLPYPNGDLFDRKISFDIMIYVFVSIYSILNFLPGFTLFYSFNAFLF